VESRLLPGLMFVALSLIAMVAFVVSAGLR
jgi:hypothetical protein